MLSQEFALANLTCAGTPNQQAARGENAPTVHGSRLEIIMNRGAGASIISVRVQERDMIAYSSAESPSSNQSSRPILPLTSVQNS